MNRCGCVFSVFFFPHLNEPKIKPYYQLTCDAHGVSDIKRRYADHCVRKMLTVQCVCQMKCEVKRGPHLFPLLKLGKKTDVEVSLAQVTWLNI